MDSTKSLGMDVFKETVSIAVFNSSGRLVMESMIETRANTFVQFVQGPRGEFHVTREEGTLATWLYDLLRPYVNEVLACDPQRNALLKAGNKSDRIPRRDRLCSAICVPPRLARVRPSYHAPERIAGIPAKRTCRFSAP